jgi:phosphoenolpyruvate synthase/pyruvate phosphate dikinase
MKKTKWIKVVERESDFWKNYMMFSSTGDVEKIFDCIIKEELTTRRGMTFVHWLNPKAVWNCSLQIEKKLSQNQRFLEKINTIFIESRKKLLDINKRLGKVDFSKLTNEKLVGFYDQFCEAYKGLYPAFHLSVYIDSVENKARSWLSNELKKIKQDNKFDDYFIRLSTWPELSLLQEEELSLRKIAIKIKTKKGNADKLLIEHTAKFAGLSVINDETRAWDKKHFKKQLNKLIVESKDRLIKDLVRLQSYSDQTKKNQLALFDELSAPRLVQKFFRLIGLLTWIRLTSRNTFALSHHASRNLFKEIGRRNNLTAEDVKWLLPSETKKLIFTGQLPSAKKINDRKLASVFLFRDGKYLFFDGKKADIFIKREVEKPFIISKLGFIKGMVANLGFACGAVKLILSQKDITKMRKGDILVARMTTPEIVPAAQLAAAIVTDEGGITCHAAIIARELKKPCIIGTKIATQVLKDGDLVEVDANKGIIKIIK